MEDDYHKGDITEFYRLNFWQDLLISWNEYHYHYPKNIKQIRNMPLWAEIINL